MLHIERGGPHARVLAEKAMHAILVTLLARSCDPVERAEIELKVDVAIGMLHKGLDEINYPKE